MTAALSREQLRRIAASHGLELLGVTDASPLLDDRAHMEASAAAGRMGTMGWMGDARAAIATEPARHVPDAKSVVVVAAPYDRSRGAWDSDADALRRVLAPVLSGTPAEPAGRIARYALGSDYHGSLRGRLQEVATDLRERGLETADTAFVDDRPLAERALAARGGLGWIGKNTNLLTHTPAGSWVFLGAVITSAELEADEPVRTSCGSCTRCLSGCPTGALIAPQTIDARRCISYLTIEHPGVLEAGEASAIGDWIFGCDVCQEVCPVNAEADDPGALQVPLIPLIDWLLPMGGRAFQRAVAETALTRAGRHRLLRNAIAALANARTPTAEAGKLLERAASDARPEVAAQARLALSS
ncbi:MAG TPA: tRNA epoxyqueuosine(34) reductase QueG [Candidatus Limnocylindria bacterium]